jgi:hypothetical protein
LETAADTRLEELASWLVGRLPGASFSLSAASADASFRRYFRVAAGARSWIAMDAPPGREDCRPFVRVAAMLRAAGVNAPEVIAQDLDRGFLLRAVQPEQVITTDQGDFSGVITVTKGEDVTKGGLALFDHDFCLTHIVEKPSPSNLDRLRREGYLRPGQPIWYNAGIYVFRPVLFEFTAQLQKSPRGEYELTDALSAMITAGHRLAGLEIQGRWVDVRDPEVLASLEQGES